MMIIKKIVVVFMVVTLMCMFSVIAIADSSFKTVIKPDDREILTSTLATPYSGIVRITMTYDCSVCTGNHKGTGFFVSDNCILTAGHVIKCKHNKYCTTLRLRVRKTGGSTYNIDNMYTLDVLDYYISPNFTSYSQTAYDYAYIKTPTNIGSNSYHFKLEEMSTSLLSNQPITVAGFSGNTFYVCDSTTCGYDLSAGLIRYYADTEGGAERQPCVLLQQ